MESRDWLLRGRDQVLVILGIAVHNLVQFLVKLLKLSSLPHVFFEHELGALKWRISALGEEFEAIVDESLVKKHTPLSQEVPSVADYLHTAIGIVTIETQKYLVVRQNRLLLNSDAFGCPSLLDRIVVLLKERLSLVCHPNTRQGKSYASYLVIADRYRVVHYIPNCPDLGLEGLFLLRRGIEKLLFLSLEVGFLLQEIVRVFLRLLGLMISFEQLRLAGPNAS